MRLFLAGISLVAVAAFGCSGSDGGTTTTDASTADGANDARADSSADGASADGADGADGGTCALVKPYSSKNAVCNQCAQTKCCSEINGCLGDPKCDDDYVNCILACALLPDDAGADAGTKPCVDQCGKDFPQGKAEYDVAIGCADTKCNVECN